MSVCSARSIGASARAWPGGEATSSRIAAATTAVRERVERGVDAYLATIEEHPQLFLLLVRHRAGDGDPLADGKARISATIARILGDALRELGVDAAGAEPWAHGLVGLGLATGEWWLERQTMTRAAVARYLTAFVHSALEGTAAELGVPLGDLDRPGVVPDTVTPLGRNQP